MAISKFEKDYMEFTSNVLQNGHLDRWEPTNSNALRLPNQTLSIDLSEGFPIRKSIKTDWKYLVKREFPSEKIWLEEHLSTLVAVLAANMRTTRAVMPFTINKTNPDYMLWGMKPIASTCNWTVTDGKLNMAVFNRHAEPIEDAYSMIFSYAIWTHIMARHLRVAAGNITILWGTMLILEKDIEYIKKWIDQYNSLCSKDASHQIKEIYDCKPTIWLNPKKGRVPDFTAKDIRIDNYLSMGDIEV